MRLLTLIVIAGCGSSRPPLANQAPAERETLWDHGTFVDPASDYTEEFTILRGPDGDKVNAARGGSQTGGLADGQSVSLLTPACEPDATFPGGTLGQQEPVGFDGGRTLLYRSLSYPGRKLVIACDGPKLAGVLEGKRVFVRKGDDALARDLESLAH